MRISILYHKEYRFVYQSMIGHYNIHPSYCATYYFMVYFNGMQAPIAQGIERRSPEPGAQVRFLLGAPLI